MSGQLVILIVMKIGLLTSFNLWFDGWKWQKIPEDMIKALVHTNTHTYKYTHIQSYGISCIIQIATGKGLDWMQHRYLSSTWQRHNGCATRIWQPAHPTEIAKCTALLAHVYMYVYECMCTESTILFPNKIFISF